jgi:hypothetical protein
MKLKILFGLMILAVWACSPAREASKTKATLTQNSQDSTMYDILIIDPYFDQWYLMNYSPAKDRLNDYYRAKNLEAVTNWNYYYTTGKYSRIIDSLIEYSSGTDYGIEVNRKLYWYFIFFTDKYKIRLFNEQRYSN